MRSTSWGCAVEGQAGGSGRGAGLGRDQGAISLTSDPREKVGEKEAFNLRKYIVVAGHVSYNDNAGDAGTEPAGMFVPLTAGYTLPRLAGSNYEPNNIQNVYLFETF